MARTACPSSDARPGATLVGVVLPGGDLAYLTSVVQVDAEFLRIARAGRPPETRFRFSQPCVEGACRQWTGQGCGLIDKVLVSHPPAAEVPEVCPIRPTCRWHLQHGSRACQTCPGVVTDGTAGDARALPALVLRNRQRERGAA